MHMTATSPRLELISEIERERARSKRFFDAFPPTSSEQRAHPSSGSAREIAHTMCTGATVSRKAVDGTLDLAKLDELPKLPETWKEVMFEFNAAQDRLLEALRASSDEELAKTALFITGPKTTTEVPRIDIVHTMLHDMIHHRGQLSVYLRMSGNKVPAIYGGSKDEPWH